MGINCWANSKFGLNTIDGWCAGKFALYQIKAFWTRSVTVQCVFNLEKDK